MRPPQEPVYNLRKLYAYLLPRAHCNLNVLRSWSLLIYQIQFEFALPGERINIPYQDRNPAPFA